MIVQAEIQTDATTLTGVVCSLFLLRWTLRPPIDGTILHHSGTVEGAFRVFYGPCLLRPRFMDDILTVIIVIGLVFFTAWLSRLSAQMNEGLNGLGATDDDIQEIKEMIEIVATILNKLPEMMPQFNMNTSPLTPIFEAFARKLSGEVPLMTYETERDSAGRFDGTQKEQAQNTPSSQTDDQSNGNA